MHWRLVRQHARAGSGAAPEVDPWWKLSALPGGRPNGQRSGRAGLRQQPHCAGDLAGPDGERHVMHGEVVAVALGQRLYLDHESLRVVADVIDSRNRPPSGRRPGGWSWPAAVYAAGRTACALRMSERATDEVRPLEWVEPPGSMAHDRPRAGPGLSVCLRPVMRCWSGWMVVDGAEQDVGVITATMAQVAIAAWWAGRRHSSARPASRSCTQAAVTSTTSSSPMVSTAKWRLRPLTFLPASQPRLCWPTVSAARTDWESTTAADGAARRPAASRTRSR